MPERFHDRGVVVTGGAQGIGKGIVEGFLQEGARVAVVDLDEGAAAATAEQLEDLGDVSAIQCDVTSRLDVERMIATSVERLGRVDVLVNNAGVASMGSCVDLTDDQWDLVMDVNVRGVFLCTQAVLPHMLDRGSGAIVNTGSEAGLQPHPLVTHYCAAKAAAIMFTRAVALEVAPAVRVNAVCPGTVNTDMMAQNYASETALTGASREEIEKGLVSHTPMGRLQTPRDIANAVLFLASDDASEITGHALNVSGGFAV
jgi:NAD(P)-dependent dehydrogenase (short-subunit alcohol dehydrogenase family)